MDSWFQLHLGDGIMAQVPCQTIREAYARARLEQALPESHVIYIRHDNEGGLQCEVTVYFPPSLEKLARQFHASPCPPPHKVGLEILAGP
ncbi:hypothetical protein QQM79_07895 [Marinobacteraceae bacterium S3BR75-40.1]